MKYKWLWLILVFSILTLLQAVTPHKAHACSCAGPATAQETLQYSDLVFYGRVVSITDNPPDQSPSAREYVPFQSRAVAFKVITVWKGSPQAEAVIYTGSGGGDCGVLFTVGEEALVYAFRDENDAFSTGSCSYWRPQDAQPDVIELGPGNPPLSQEIIAEYVRRQQEVTERREAPTQPPILAVRNVEGTTAPVSQLVLGSGIVAVLLLASIFSIIWRRSRRSVRVDTSKERQ